MASLDGAKAEFEASWKQWKAWAKMEEVELRKPPELARSGPHDDRGLRNSFPTHRL